MAITMMATIVVVFLGYVSSGEATEIFLEGFINSNIYYFLSYLETPSNKKKIIASCVLLSIAPLVKLPSLYVMIPVFWLAWKKSGKKVFRRIDLWFFCIFISDTVKVQCCQEGFFHYPPDNLSCDVFLYDEAA